MARGVGDGSKSAANDLRQQLGTSLNAPGTSGVFRTLLTLLAEGMPVPKGAVARALGRPERDVVDLLAQIPSLEFDDAGDIVGAGLSLRPTMHLFEIGGRRLYTWCALDTLIFPAMLGRTARVTSPCAATGASVAFSSAQKGSTSWSPRARSSRCICSKGATSATLSAGT